MLSIRTEILGLAWEGAAAVACFIGAILAGAIGSLLTTGWILNAQLHPRLYTVGVILLIMSLPILIVAGHYLDLLERRKEKF